jgi:DNA-binding beta-propeller fold protein YncE
MGGVVHRWSSICFVAFLVALVCVAGPAAALAGGYRVAQVWGEAGNGRGQLRVPKGVSVADDGSVWVVDFGNQTMLKYAATGELLGAWGGPGSAPGKFDRPSRVAVGPDGTVYVTDATNQRIQRFSRSGDFLGQWGRPGTGPGEFDYPRGIDVARDGTVYVTDQANHRVQVFTARGEYLRQWGTQGRGRGQFALAKDVAVSGDGRVYVADARTDLVQIFTTKGKWLGDFGGEGSARGRLAGPRGLGVDARGHVFVADTMNHRIQEFSASGVFMREWGCEGPLDGMFQAPRDIAQAPDGSMVVVDTYNHRLQRFVRDGSGDDGPPVTLCAQHAGWWTAPLELSLTATDGASEVAVTWASVDGAKFRSAADGVRVTGQGRHAVRFLSVDAAGNQERIRRRAFVLDWTAPGASFAARAPLRVVAGATVRPSLSVADALSPTCRVWIRLDRDGEQVWQKSLGRVEVSPPGRTLAPALAVPRAAGRYVLTVTARDRAGNVGRSSLDLLVRGH